MQYDNKSLKGRWEGQHTHLFKHATISQEPQQVPVRQPPRNLLHPFVRHEDIDLLLLVGRLAVDADVAGQQLGRDVFRDRREGRRDGGQGLVLEAGAVLVRERGRGREERVWRDGEAVRDLCADSNTETSVSPLYSI